MRYNHTAARRIEYQVPVLPGNQVMCTACQLPVK